LRKVSIN